MMIPPFSLREKGGMRGIRIVGLYALFMIPT